MIRIDITKKIRTFITSDGREIPFSEFVAAKKGGNPNRTKKENTTQRQE